MSRLLTISLLLPMTAAAWARPDDVSPEPPPPAPVLLEIIGERTLTLDRMGMTKADWIKAARDGRLPPLTTGLKLRIRNNLKVALRVRLSGLIPALTLDLKPSGMGEAVAHERRNPAKGGRIAYEIIPPGRWYDLPLPALQGFTRTNTTSLYPSGAGEWKLSAEYTTYLYEPNAMGGWVAHKGTTRHTLKAKPVTLTVREK